MVRIIPFFHACLNFTAAVLLLIGFFLIKNKRTSLHRLFMLTAGLVSAVFLGSYVRYHLTYPPVHFGGIGGIRIWYFLILITHVTLAVALVPLAWMTVARALKGQWERHKAIARWAFPIWLYVSVTGVVVYWMLYE